MPFINPYCPGLASEEGAQKDDLKKAALEHLGSWGPLEATSILEAGPSGSADQRELKPMQLTNDGNAQCALSRRRNPYSVRNDKRGARLQRFDVEGTSTTSWDLWE
jgi:hypothetical protein